MQGRRSRCYGVQIGVIARLKGEEPGVFAKLPHALKGAGHYGEYLTEYALKHGGLGEAALFSNVIVPRSSGPTSTSEIDMIMLHEKRRLCHRVQELLGLDIRLCRPAELDRDPQRQLQRAVL